MASVTKTFIQVRPLYSGENHAGPAAVCLSSSVRSGWCHHLHAAWCPISPGVPREHCEGHALWLLQCFQYHPTIAAAQEDSSSSPFTRRTPTSPTSVTYRSCSTTAQDKGACGKFSSDHTYTYSCELPGIRHWDGGLIQIPGCSHEQ